VPAKVCCNGLLGDVGCGVHDAALPAAACSSQCRVAPRWCNACRCGGAQMDRDKLEEHIRYEANMYSDIRDME
jgi:hypothetical protein